jgi:hypothetical protein
MTRAALLCLGVVLATASCTGLDQDDNGVAVSVERTLELGPPFEEGETSRVRVREDGLLEIITLGSGSCPYVPIKLDRESEDRIEITMEKRGGDCTDDLSPTTATVRLPGDVEYRDSPLRVDIDGLDRDVSLPVRLGFGPDGQPDPPPGLALAPSEFDRVSVCGSAVTVQESSNGNSPCAIATRNTATADLQRDLLAATPTDAAPPCVKSSRVLVLTLWKTGNVGLYVPSVEVLIDCGFARRSGGGVGQLYRLPDRTVRTLLAIAAGTD